MVTAHAASIAGAPSYFGFPSHFIPLVKLYQRLAGSTYDAAFVLPRLAPTDIAAQRRNGFNENTLFYYGSEFLSQFDLPVLAVG